MKYYDCEMADLIYDKLKEIYSEKQVNKDRSLNKEGRVEIYFFNIWKGINGEWVPMACLAYDDNFGKAFLATSTDGTKEKPFMDFLSKKGIRNGIETMIQENSLEIVMIPFSRIKEL